MDLDSFSYETYHQFKIFTIAHSEVEVGHHRPACVRIRVRKVNPLTYRNAPCCLRSVKMSSAIVVYVVRPVGYRCTQTLSSPKRNTFFHTVSNVAFCSAPNCVLVALFASVV